MKSKTKKFITTAMIIVLIAAAIFLVLKFYKPFGQTAFGSADYAPDAPALLHERYPYTLNYVGNCTAYQACVGVVPHYTFTNKVIYLDGKLQVQMQSNGETFGTYSLGNGCATASEGYCPAVQTWQQNNVGTYQTTLSITPQLQTRVLDDCAGGGIDTSAGVKCLSYCRPNVRTCVARSFDMATEFQYCTADGQNIVHQICIGGCDNDLGCLGGSYSGNPLLIQLIAVNDGFYGGDYKPLIRVMFDGAPAAGAAVTGTIVTAGKQVATAYGVTKIDGSIELTFPKVTTSGQSSITFSTTVRGIYKNISSNIYFNEQPPLVLTAAMDKASYVYREDVVGTATVKVGDQPYSNPIILSLVNVDTGGIIQQQDTVSTGQGYANVTFTNVEFIGRAKLVVKSNSMGKQYSAESSAAFFEGNPFKTAVSTKSQVQYNTAPVEFYAHIEDEYGQVLTPNMVTNMRASATVSQGSASSTGASITYLGDGDYKISVPVSGYGTFYGKLMFDYQNNIIATQQITIELRQDSLAIDTSAIPAAGTRNQNMTIEMHFASASGRVVDPTSITVEVTHPSGIAKDIITTPTIKKQSEGTWSFVYSNFKEVEKYSFNIYADKGGYTRGSAQASVSVGGEAGTTSGMAGTPVIGWAVSNSMYIIVGSIVLIAGFILIKRKFFNKNNAKIK